MKDYLKEHLVIVRTSGSIMNLNTYNCQELGLAKAISKKGLKVSLVLAGRKTCQEKVDGIDVWYCSFSAINQQLAWFHDLNDILTQLHPTCIQVHDMGVFMTWKVVCWARKHNIPSFLIQGNYQTTLKPVFKQFEQLFNMTFGKYVLKNVTGIGYKTLMASRYVKHYYNRETKPTYIGLDDTKFQKSIYKDWHAELKLDRKKILLYVGSQEPRRNPLFLLEVMKHLSEDYVLLMVGSGPLVSDVNHSIEASGMSNRIIQLGKRSQELLPSLYKISDAFLLASNYEIYGMVILEAMYFGLPVISTLTAGSETLIEHGKDGYIISELNVEKWVSTIKKLCEDSELHRMMRNAASVKIQHYLMWDKTADGFLDLYFGK